MTRCGCFEDYSGTILCPLHEEIKKLVIQKKPDFKRAMHLVELGYRKNGQGTLPKTMEEDSN